MKSKKWSEGLIKATKEHFYRMGFGLVKHIDGKDSLYALDTDMFGLGKLKEITPEAEQDKQVFLYSFKDYNMFKGPTEPKFEKAYESIDDMIDDGWAVD